MGRAARAKAERRRLASDDQASTMQARRRGHDHEWRNCGERLERENRVAQLAHRVRQQNEQIVRLQEMLDDRAAGGFFANSMDRSLPARAS